MSGWTPFKENSRTILAVQDRRGFFVASAVDERGDVVAQARGKSADEARERIVKISAAPELYEALEKLLTALRAEAAGEAASDHAFEDACETARAVLLKAKGNPS